MATTNQGGPDWDSIWAQESATPGWDFGHPNLAFIDFLRAPSNPPTSPDANPTPGAPETNTFEYTEEVRLPAPLKEDGSRRKALVPGCGTGYDVALLASWGYDAYGLEISKHAVAKANAYLKIPDKGKLKGEYKIKDETIGKGSAQCLLGDYFDDAWLREAGAVEGFDIIYDHTVCLLQAKIPQSRENMLISCPVLVLLSASPPSTLGSTNSVFTFPHRDPRLHRIPCGQARICRRPAVFAPTNRPFGAVQAARRGSDLRPEWCGNCHG